MNKTLSLACLGLLSSGLLIPVAQAAQTCNPAAKRTTPDSAFTLNGDTVTHNPTQLVWLRCSLGQSWNGTTCTGSATAYNWQSALQQANVANLGGYSDWRLPNIKELRSIVEHACYNPSINEAVFPATPASAFWSSSPGAGRTDGAWIVTFGSGDGGSSNKNGLEFVRLVRGGQ